MARFYASITGRKTDHTDSTSVSRMGAAGVDAHIRGWDSGVKVRGYINPTTGEDEFEVWTTGGSRDDGIKRMIGTLTAEGFLHANPSSR